MSQLFAALMPLLDEHRFMSFNNAELQGLNVMLQEYHEARNDEAKAKNRHSAKPSFAGDNDSDDSDAAEEEIMRQRTCMAEMDEALAKIRRFLQRRIPFGTIEEPNAAPSTASGAVKGVAETTSNLKRVRTEELADPDSAVPAPVYAVDAFLYEEHDIDALAAAHQLSREYCRRCGGTDIGLCDFITHSFSQDQIVYLSGCLLPHLLSSSEFSVMTSTGGKTDGAVPAPSLVRVVDVGSRLGIVLWGCALAMQHGLLSLPPQHKLMLTGVELDKHLVAVQKDVFSRFFAPRRRCAPRVTDHAGHCGCEGGSTAELPSVAEQVEILQCSCFEGPGRQSLQGAAVVVLHNVFEYFSSGAEEHLRCWQQIRQLVCHPGQLLICSPSLESTLSSFSPDVWSTVMGSDKGDSEAPERWLASYAERVDIAATAASFLKAREVDGGCDEDCSSHDEAAGPLDRDTADGDGGASELAELVNSIHVYRVR